MLVAVSLLAISLSFLVYHSPPSTWRNWLSPSPPPKRPESPAGPEKASHKDSAQHINPRGEQQQILNPQIQNVDVIPPADSPQTTPKAAASGPPNEATVPTFTLAEHESSDEEDDLPPPSFPALNSAQRASARNGHAAPPVAPGLMAPPPKPTPMAPPSKPTTSSLMPPPSLKAANLRSLPTNSPSSLRVPANGPLPNRGPVPNRAPTNGANSLAPFSSLSNSSIKPPNARNKVLLSPGHSPLDWANLQRSGSNLSGVPSLVRVTPSMLKHNNGRKGKPAWSSYQGKVYNITPYLPFHPGGEGELRRAAGKDGGKLFMEVHPWVNWDNMLGECLVGVMVSEEQAPADGSGSLEDMD